MLTNIPRYTKNFIKTLCSISDGNKKLKSNDKVRYIIWNLPAISTCPYATAHCKKSCYACKSEKAYPTVLPARKRNYEFSLTDDFVPVMISYILSTVAWERKHGNRLVWVRIHESGDFYNRGYVEKWLKIMRIVNAFAGDQVVFHAYTKSLPFFDGVNIPKNFVLMSSIWDDTKPEMVALTEKLGLPIYTAYAKGHEPKGTLHCDCNDCANCQICIKAKTGDVVACEIH